MAIYIYSIHCSKLKWWQLLNNHLFETCWLEDTFPQGLQPVPSKCITHGQPRCFIKTEFCLFVPFLKCNSIFCYPPFCSAAGYVQRRNVFYRIIFVIIYAEEQKGSSQKNVWARVPRFLSVLTLSHHQQVNERDSTETGPWLHIKERAGERNAGKDNSRARGDWNLL